MSLYPYILNEMLNELQRPTIFDQHFALGVPTNELISYPLRAGYLRPWQRHHNPRDSGSSDVVSNNDGFKVNLDVQHFKPEELNVKVVDNYIVVDGKHEEKSDEHGYISRQFTRRYKLPQGTDANGLVSKLSSDGVLQLHAPKLALGDVDERVIPITCTNQPALQQQSGQHSSAPVKSVTAVKTDAKPAK